MDIDFILRAVQVATVKYVDETWGNFRLIQGTKTFNDLNSGQCEYKFFQLLKRYRKQLTWFQQIQITTLEKILQLQYLLQRASKKTMRLLKNNLLSIYQ